MVTLIRSSLHGFAPVVQVLATAASVLCLGCGGAAFDESDLLERVEALSSDAFEGRAVGTPGSMAAQKVIADAFRSVRLDSLSPGYAAPFVFEDRDGDEVAGTNLAGRVSGTRYPDRYIVLSAHYDHLGVREGEIYNGADDNASGTSAIIAIAEALMDDRPDHSVLVVAFDAEERGLRGARAFVVDPPVPVQNLVANVNLDMVSRSTAGELYAAGTYHYPELRPILESVQPSGSVSLLFGHDRPEDGNQDWTNASDHGPFHAAGIPFVYFGVEDHPGYHTPEDDYGEITHDFYVDAVRTILDAVEALDRALATGDAVAQ